MLPGPTTPAAPDAAVAAAAATPSAAASPPWTRQRPRWLVLLLAVMLSLGLAACGGVGQPSQKVLLAALELQIELTQRSIATALALPAQGEPLVSRVRVESQQALSIGSARGLHLTGRFDWRLPGDPIRVDSPFELYLQRGERGQSWRLARPAGSADGASQDWFIDPLPLPGERA